MISTRFHFQDGKMITQRTQDCTAILENAKARHNEGLHGSSEFRSIGHIPGVVIEDFINRKGITLFEFYQDEALLSSFLNDPEIGLLRIWKGRV